MQAQLTQDLKLITKLMAILLMTSPAMAQSADQQQKTADVDYLIVPYEIETDLESPSEGLNLLETFPDLFSEVSLAKNSLIVKNSGLLNNFATYRLALAQIKLQFLVDQARAKSMNILIDKHQHDLDTTLFSKLKKARPKTKKLAARWTDVKFIRSLQSKITKLSNAEYKLRIAVIDQENIPRTSQIALKNWKKSLFTTSLFETADEKFTLDYKKGSFKTLSGEQADLEFQSNGFLPYLNFIAKQYNGFILPKGSKVWLDFLNMWKGVGIFSQLVDKEILYYDKINQNISENIHSAWGVSVIMYTDDHIKFD